MTGHVCPKHEEWCPTGVCRWCEPAPERTLSDIFTEVVEMGALLPIPIVMHFPQCAQTPCNCASIAAARAGNTTHFIASSGPAVCGHRCITSHALCVRDPGHAGPHGVGYLRWTT